MSSLNTKIVLPTPVLLHFRKLLLPPGSLSYYLGLELVFVQMVGPNTEDASNRVQYEIVFQKEFRFAQHNLIYQQRVVSFRYMVLARQI